MCGTTPCGGTGASTAKQLLIEHYANIQKVKTANTQQAVNKNVVADASILTWKDVGLAAEIAGSNAQIIKANIAIGQRNKQLQSGYPGVPYVR